jgi:hypothetical protein
MEQRHIAEQLLEEGLTPLAIMKARMLRRPLSNGTLVTDDQFAAACGLAPYVHPKLTAMAVRDMTPGIGVQVQDSTPSIKLVAAAGAGRQAINSDPDCGRRHLRPEEASKIDHCGWHPQSQL